MKILHVIPDYRLGGAETLLTRLALATRSAGHRVEIVSLKQIGAVAQPLEGTDIAVNALHGPDRPGPSLARAVLGLGPLIRKSRPDVIHAWLASGCAAVHLTAPSTIPCIYAIHVTDLPPRPVQLLLASDRGAAVRWLGVSRAVADAWIAALRLPSMLVIPNGVDPGPEPPPPPPGARPAFLGRLAHQKGVDVLLRALKGTSLHVDIFGTGPELDALALLADALGVSGQAHFRGMTPSPRHALESSSMLVLPSRSEGMPMVALEAMAAGRPVLATHIRGTDEVVVPGETGVLVPSEDPMALRTALLALQADHARRASMGVAGRAMVVDRFSGSVWVKRMLSLYADVCIGTPSVR